MFHINFGKFELSLHPKLQIKYTEKSIKKKKHIENSIKYTENSHCILKKKKKYKQQTYNHVLYIRASFVTPA